MNKVNGRLALIASGNNTATGTQYGYTVYSQTVK